MRIWDMKPTDVMRFVLSREQFNVLIEAIAGNAAWIPGSKRGKLFEALDVLRVAECDVDASIAIQALTEIVEYTKKSKDNDMIIIHGKALSGLNSKKEDQDL
jgi:hypothetical protein